MYAPQPTIPSATKYFLDALSTGEAQLKTPDGTPTVFAQRLQQGIAQGMPQVQGMPQAKQEFQQAVPSVMRNMQQQQMQQMVQQAMQPKPVGIEGVAGPKPPVPGVAGITAQNMQRMQQMAEGGVVGFAGDGEFGSVVPEVVALDELRVAEAKRKREDAERQKMLEFLEQAGSPLAEKYRRTTPASTAPARPPAAAQQPKPAVSRPAAPTPPAAVPQGGIAQLAAPTLGAAMSEVEKQLPGSGLEQNRTELERLQQMRKARPDTGQMTSKALEEEGGVAAALKAKMDQSAQTRGIMSWLMGGEGRGASARSYEGFRKAEDQRQMLHAQENTIRIAKIEAIKEANEARKIGDQESYVNALNKIAELERADKQVKATLAANVFQSETARYGTDVGARERGLDRDAADKRARERNAALLAVAKAKGVKPPPGMGMGDLKALQDMVIAEFNPKRLGPQALTFLNSLPNGAQLVRDIQNGNVKPGSSQWEKEVAPKLVLGAEIYKQSLLRQTKFGAQPMPYSAAAAALGVSPAADEDED